MGFVDDWSYIESARVFARTGHFAYNGWATAMLGWQIGWGSLFIRLFGFSFEAVKLSTLPLAAASIFLFYKIQTRFGITPRNAIIGALTLALSPLFLPLAASFMSDVPGLFVVLLCLYCCQRAVAVTSASSTIVWLAAAAATNVAGGTARQIAWLGALVMVPATAWFLRQRRGVLPAGAVLWIASVAGVLACVGWFAHQPYSIPEAVFSGNIHDSRWISFVFNLCAQILCLLLVVLPVLIAWLPQIRNTTASGHALFGCILAAWLLIQALMRWTLPWTPHVLHSEFAANRIPSMQPDTGPLLFPVWALLAVSVLVAAAALAFVLTVSARFSVARKFIHERQLQELFWLSVPFTISYFALLIPRAWFSCAVDRYLLPLMPIAILGLIRLYQQLIGPRLPSVSMVALAVFALAAVSGTHDWFAWQRARLAAVAQLQAADIARTAIQGGFELDGWTQIEQGGHINDPRIAIPSGAYQTGPLVAQLSSACRLDFAPYTPAIKPRYTIAYPPMPCLARSTFPAISYRAWLPPFRRSITTQEIPREDGPPARKVKREVPKHGPALIAVAAHSYHHRQSGLPPKGP